VVGYMIFANFFASRSGGDGGGYVGVVSGESRTRITI